MEVMFSFIDGPEDLDSVIKELNLDSKKKTITDRFSCFNIGVMGYKVSRPSVELLKKMLEAGFKGQIFTGQHTSKVKIPLTLEYLASKNFNPKTLAYHGIFLITIQAIKYYIENEYLN